jgi:hypothetical protein
MEMAILPQDLLLRFFQEACRDLNDCKISGPFSLVDLRNLLLTNQRFCLDRVVDEYNLKNNSTQWTSPKVQDCLKNLQSQEIGIKVKEAMEAMNDAARLAFCRLVLYSECLRRQESEQDESASGQQHLEKEVPITRSQLLEFSGLCSAATRLPNVQNYVSDGTDLFNNDKTATLMPQTVKDDDPSRNIPPYRLDVIQRLFFQAVEIDPDHGMAEIKRIFFSGENHDHDHDELANDAELVSIFQAAVTRMNAMLTGILQQQQQASMAKLSDFNDGGVTRVVAVEYSEKIVDEMGQVVESGSSQLGPVARQAMEQQNAQQQQEQFDVARQAGALQQEILGELFSLSEELREEKLAEAEKAEQEFLAKAIEFPAGPERISFLRSVGPETQRLMVMRKLWLGMLAAHGGKPPEMRTKPTNEVN